MSDRRLSGVILLGIIAAGLCFFAASCASRPKPKPAGTPGVAGPGAPAPATPEQLPPVLLGIDVLEADRFAAIAGKKIGLLTHQAGLNRRGETTIDVLRRAPRVTLVALFSPEHGLDGVEKAGANVADTLHRSTGLPVYSLHGKTRKPTPAMLKGLDALVIDLQDIGSRSYTFVSCMLYAMAAAFENDVEVIVLDRPNPLGGLKVDGPPLDAEFKSYVGAFRVPYVHGLTIGELARLAKDSPGPGVMQVPGPTGINTPEPVRAKGRLTVIPMRGWHRAMRWPDTGLKWVATSPMIQDFNATVGYAMTGIGCELGGWTHGIGTSYPFRGISYKGKTPDQIIAELSQYQLPGLKLVKAQALNREGKLVDGVYLDVVDWDAWRPTEISFYMMKTAAKWSAANPYTAANTGDQTMFMKIVGSAAWRKELVARGSRIDVSLFTKNWAERAAVYQKASQKYWLYE